MLWRQTVCQGILSIYNISIQYIIYNLDDTMVRYVKSSPGVHFTEVKNIFLSLPTWYRFQVLSLVRSCCPL